MPFKVTPHLHPEYVRCDVAGRTSLKRFADLMAMLGMDVDQHERDRVLLDLRNVEGRLTMQEQQMVGELVTATRPSATSNAAILEAG